MSNSPAVADGLGRRADHDAFGRDRAVAGVGYDVGKDAPLGLLGIAIV
jgi:hypothetical protein